MNIQKRIKSLRTESGLRQSELGKAVGVSAQVISNIERGYTKPSTELVNRCAKYFGVPADYPVRWMAIFLAGPLKNILQQSKKKLLLFLQK